MRIGAVLVPLSTLLRPPELLTQLHTAQVSYLLTTTEFRGRRFLEEMEEAASGLLGDGKGGGRHPVVPSLRRIWAIDGIPDATAPHSLVRALEKRV